MRRQRNVPVVLSRCFKFGDFPRRGLHGRRFGFFAGEVGNLGIFGVHSPLKSKLGKSRGGFSERGRCEGMDLDFPGKKNPKKSGKSRSDLSLDLPVLAGLKYPQIQALLARGPPRKSWPPTKPLLPHQNLPWEKQNPEILFFFFFPSPALVILFNNFCFGLRRGNDLIRQRSCDRTQRKPREKKKNKTKGKKSKVKVIKTLQT